MDDFPRNFAALVTYLRENPRIQCEHYLPGESFTGQFAGARDERLHFVTDAGKDIHTPAAGKGGPDGFRVEVDYHDAGFNLRMFGKTLRFRYAPPPNDAANNFLVSCNLDRLLIGRPPLGAISRPAALNLAAWLVTLADPTGLEFAALLTSVKQ
jgi:hypothetical protein